LRRSGPLSSPIPPFAALAAKVIVSIWHTRNLTAAGRSGWSARLIQNTREGVTPGWSYLIATVCAVTACRFWACSTHVNAHAPHGNRPSSRHHCPCLRGLAGSTKHCSHRVAPPVEGRRTHRPSSNSPALSSNPNGSSVLWMSTDSNWRNLRAPGKPVPRPSTWRVMWCIEPPSRRCAAI
jgi:hypothetical protein